MTAQELIKLAVFEGKEIRRTLHNGDWWFVKKALYEKKGYPKSRIDKRLRGMAAPSLAARARISRRNPVSR